MSAAKLTKTKCALVERLRRSGAGNYFLKKNALQKRNILLLKKEIPQLSRCHANFFKVICWPRKPPLYVSQITVRHHKNSKEKKAKLWLV